jgi:hypothetical protein
MPRGPPPSATRTGHFSAPTNGRIFSAARHRAVSPFAARGEIDVPPPRSSTRWTGPSPPAASSVDSWSARGTRRRRTAAARPRRAGAASRTRRRGAALPRTPDAARRSGPGCSERESSHRWRTSGRARMCAGSPQGRAGARRPGRRQERKRTRAGIQPPGRARWAQGQSRHCRAAPLTDGKKTCGRFGPSSAA